MEQMKTKHTPGPWKFEDATDEMYSAIRGADHSIVIVIENDEISNADKNLMLAAPDLLATMKDLFEQCAMVHKHWGEGSNTEQANKAVEAARAAIEKAGGGQLCKHGTEPIYRCPDNADHDEACDFKQPGPCEVCEVEKAQI